VRHSRIRRAGGLTETVSRSCSRPTRSPSNVPLACPEPPLVGAASLPRWELWFGRPAPGPSRKGSVFSVVDTGRRYCSMLEPKGRAADTAVPTDVPAGARPSGPGLSGMNAPRGCWPGRTPCVSYGGPQSARHHCGRVPAKVALERLSESPMSPPSRRRFSSPSPDLASAGLAEAGPGSSPVAGKGDLAT
jgi:hypothetical protein